MPSNPERSGTASGPQLVRALDRRIRRNWLILCWLAVVITVGLALSLAFAMWPWSGAELHPVLGLAILVACVAIYLTGQQRHLARNRRQVNHIHKVSTEQRYQRLFDLLNVSHLLDPKAQPQDVFDRIPKLCLELFDCEKSSLMLHDEKNAAYLRVQSAAGYCDRKIVGARQRIGEGIAGWVAESRRPVLLSDREDKRQYPGLSFTARSVAAAIVVPIIVGDDFLGVLNISTASDEAYYDEEDLRAVQAFAANVGACIANATTARTMRQTIEEQQRALNEMFVKKA